MKLFFLIIILAVSGCTIQRIKEDVEGKTSSDFDKLKSCSFQFKDEMWNGTAERIKTSEDFFNLIGRKDLLEQNIEPKNCTYNFTFEKCKKISKSNFQFWKDLFLSTITITLLTYDDIYTCNVIINGHNEYGDINFQKEKKLKRRYAIPLVYMTGHDGYVLNEFKRDFIKEFVGQLK